MLIISRRVGERVQVGDNVFVKVIEIDGGQVRLGFEAPKQVAIIREDAEVKEPKTAPPK